MIRFDKLLPLLGGLGLTLSGCEWFPECSPEEPIDDPPMTTESPEPEPEPEPPPPTCADLDLPPLAVDPDPTCVNEPQTGTFTPVEEWSIDTFVDEPTSRSVMMTPIVFPPTATATEPVVAFVTYAFDLWLSAGVVRVVSGDGSTVLWSNADAWVEGSGNLAAADIDGDGVTEVIGVTIAKSDAQGFGKRVVAFGNDGTVEWESGPLPGLGPCNASSPSVADLDGDGNPEIVVGPHILSSDGTLRATGFSGTGQCASFAADLDGDGDQEVVVGNAVYDIDGVDQWDISANDGYPAIGNFDDDDAAEVVVVDVSGLVRLHDTDGTELWRSATVVGQGPPTVADFDGDGLPEIGVAGTSSYAVLDTDGTELWRRSTVDGSSGRTGSSVFDFEGDGIAEVIYADEFTVWVFSGVDGSVKLEDPDHTSWTWSEYSIVVDVDNDGQAEIVAPHGSIAGSVDGAVYGISVIGDADQSWVPARTIWNQFAYHIDNIADDGSVPASPDPGWLTHNSFRSGDLRAAPGLEAPDLQVVALEACEDECGAGRLVIDVQAANRGAADLSFGAVLTLSGTRSDGTVVPLGEAPIEALEAGEQLPGWRFVVERSDLVDLDSVSAALTSDDLECLDDNNQSVLDGPFCN